MHNILETYSPMYPVISLFLFSPEVTRVKEDVTQKTKGLYHLGCLIKHELDKHKHYRANIPPR